MHRRANDHEGLVFCEQVEKWLERHGLRTSKEYTSKKELTCNAPNENLEKLFEETEDQDE